MVLIYLCSEVNKEISLSDLLDYLSFQRFQIISVKCIITVCFIPRVHKIFKLSLAGVVL